MTTETKINSKISVHIVITAAGSSSRMGTGVKKEYVKLQDKDNNTVLSLACFSFLNTFCNLIDLDKNLNSKCALKSIVITCPPSKTDQAKEAVFSNTQIPQLIKSMNIDLSFIEGGNTRQTSVFNALSSINSKIVNGKKSDNEIVLIHDGARPWIESATILNVLKTTLQFGAAVPATPVTDTTAFVENDVIKKYVDRTTLFNLQTPQGFDFIRLYNAHELCAKENRTDCTDDTTLWKAYCGDVHICEGSLTNKKITFKGDI